MMLPSNQQPGHVGFSRILVIVTGTINHYVQTSYIRDEPTVAHNKQLIGIAYNS